MDTTEESSNDINARVPGVHRTVPRVSVRVLTYNYGAFLGQCLQSVLDQSFEDFEVIVIDDGSTDDSSGVAASFAQHDHRIRVITHETNRGFVESLIHSTQLVRGEYQMLLDADDWLLARDALSVLVDRMDADPKIAFCFAPYALYVDETATPWIAEGLGADLTLSGADAIGRVMAFTVPHSGTMVRTSTLETIGGYDRTYRYGPDMKLFYSLCAHGEVGYVHRPLTAHRAHQSSMSSISRWKDVYDDSVGAIDSVFAGSLGRQIPNSRVVYRTALRSFLQHHPTKDIFAGRYANGWRLFALHASRKPWLTIVQWNTLLLVGRTVVGERAYKSIRHRLRRGGD